MYIKQVTIEGFRSYKEKTVVEFSKRHNVVVGKNGSGKSNVFKALEFLLSNQYRTISSKEWQKWVYEGSERRVQASVEIVFDNESGQLPVPEEEVVIKRIFGAKKDQWLLNQKNTNKEDVTSLLESAGLSRTNPYYIVAQGQVTQLIKMKDAQRLQLVKDIAGTRVYDDRRKESMKIMQETDRKRTQISDIMDYFNTRLTELEEEQEELREYQVIDRKIRAVQLTLYRNKVESAEKQKARLEKQSLNNIDVEEAYERLNEKRERRDDMQKKLKQLEAESVSKRKEQSRLTKERRKAHKHLQKTKLSMETTREKLVQQMNRKEEIKSILKDLEQQISQTDQRLKDQLRPENERRRSVEDECQNRLIDFENRRDDLYSKQDRNTNFRNKEERDAHLKSLLAENEVQLAQVKQDAENINKKLEETKAKLEKEEELIRVNEAKQDELNQRTNEAKEQHNEMKKEKDKRMALRKKAQKEVKEFKDKLKNTKQDLKGAESKFRGAMNRKMWDSYQNTKKLVKKHKIEGVYGPLIELFEVDENFEKCVEIVGHNRLLNWVVKNDDVASRIVETLQKSNGGRITLMPLNRLYFNQKRGPNSNSAFWMVEKLTYIQDIDPAMKQVFGNWLICRDLPTAQQFSEQYDLDATNLDGDTVNRRGAITGGYYDNKSVSRICAMREMKKFERQIDELQASMDLKKKKAQTRHQEMSTLLGNIHKIEGDRSSLRTELTNLSEEITTSKTNKRAYHTLLEETQRNEKKQEHEIRRCEQKLKRLQEEMSTEFNQALTNEEAQELETLADDIERARTELQAASREKIEIERETKSLENELNENLLKQQDDLEKNLTDINEDELREIYEKHEKEMQQASNNQNELDKEIQVLEEENESSLQKNLQFQKKTEELSTQIRVLEKELNQANVKSQSAHKTIKNLEETIILENEKIRKLGTLPDEEYIEMYQDLSKKKLEQNLKRESKKLKAFANVNKKALDQYEHFTQQRDQLMKRQKDQEKSKKAIQELIDHLDKQKDEAIQRTYKAIAVNFGKVFGELVDGGTGKFVLFKRESSSNDEDDEKASEEHKTTDLYNGIGIRVSFTGGRDDLYSMTQLSGGQQTVVALSLIFAIQRCDPSPFYLFDEIDAALDAVHRQSVAQMIHSNSNSSQFITTTFRPEMLQTADKFIGIFYLNKISVARAIEQEHAQSIIAEDQAIDEKDMQETSI